MSTDKRMYRNFYDEDEKVVKEIIYYNFDNLRDGPYYLFYSNGKYKKKCHYINGKLDGLVEYFDESGDIVEEINYVNGVKQGEHNKYREGKLIRSIDYSDGRMESCVIN